MILGMAEFPWMLNHELLLARRHERYVSLALLKTNNGENLLEAFGNSFRESDAYFEFSDSTGALLMNEADSAGVQVAINRFIRNSDGRAALSYAFGTYPEQNIAGAGFMANLFEELDRASTPGQFGASPLS